MTSAYVSVEPVGTDLGPCPVGLERPDPGQAATSTCPEAMVRLARRLVLVFDRLAEEVMEHPRGCAEAELMAAEAVDLVPLESWGSVLGHYF